MMFKHGYITIWQEIRWLTQPPLLLLHASTKEPLERELRRIGFTPYTMDGSRIHDEVSLFQEANRAFDPSGLEFHSGNWNGMDECLEEFRQRMVTPVALVWDHFDVSLTQALRPSLEGLRYFVNETLPSTWKTSGPEFAQFCVFFLGRSEGFSIHSPNA